ncbi:hypothetical protein FRB98_004423 [Tulasnella sp. 332]|nr:hypothetical protein FRB98_004423 [Tulasnella sp. 332]
MRKGHGSSKVPNVKLRPAPATKPTRTASTPTESEEYEVETVDRGFDGIIQKPLEGVIICCTGISDKPTLLAQARELGASHSNDYTDRITHLIASAAGSAKYQCALERNTPIMEPAWISRSYEKWLKGADISLEESERKYRLPAFQGLWIAITGEDDVPRRTSLAKLISFESGRYCKEVNERVTHLVVCSPVGSDEEVDSEKVKWAKGVNAQRRKQGVLPAGLIKIVWEEWLWDCKEWQGKWDEAKYRIEIPRPDRKAPPVSAEPEFEAPSFNNCATSTQFFTPGSSSSLLAPPSRAPTKPKLQLLDPEGSVEIANTRGAAVTGDRALLQKGLWDDIVSNASQQPLTSKAKGKEVFKRPRPNVDGKLSDTEDEDDGPPGSAPDIRANFPQNDTTPLIDDSRPSQKSFLSRVTRAEAYSTGPSLESSMSLQLAAGPSKPTTTSARLPDAPRTKGMDDSSLSSQVFSALKLRTLGGASHKVLVSMVERNGGTVVKSEADDDLSDADFVIVRLHEAPRFVDDHHPLLSKFRTECWIESCAFEERLCGPEEDVVFTPLRTAFPILGAENIHIVWSGLRHSESHHLKQLCKVLGIIVPDKFCRKTTHLICPERAGPKYEKALEWGIPVFDLQWVWNIAQTGMINGVAPAVQRNASKNPIVDITNCSSDDGQRSREQLKQVKRSIRREDDPFGAPDYSILGGSDHSPSKALSPIKSPTKVARPSLLARSSTAPASPTRKTHRPPDFGRQTSSGPSTLRSLGSGVAALLGKHLQESPAEESNTPPRKKARPASRAKSIMDSNRYSASVSPSHSPASFVMPVSATISSNHDSRSDEDDGDLDHKAETMQVFYADPTQEAEKERFMQLIENGGRPPPVVAAHGPAKKKEAANKSLRRSTRKSGF